MSENRDFSVKTGHIALRIAAACANPREKPTFLHWSDAAVLADAADYIRALEAQVQAQRLALHLALKLAR